MCGCKPTVDSNPTATAKIARVETNVALGRDRGLAVPAYVVRAFRDALERAAARPASDFGPSSHVR